MSGRERTNREKLGRKILDLIEENEVQLYEDEKVIELNITQIKRNPEQPRVVFDKDRLMDLAKSIKRFGVIHPVIVKPFDEEEGTYMLISGERRIRASRMIGKRTVPAIIRDYDSEYLAEIAILETLQNKNLTAIEEAAAYQRAMKTLEITQAELAEKIGKSRSYVTNILGLLRLPTSVINDVNRGLISTGHAKVLSKLDDDDLAVYLSGKIKDENLNVRDTEEIARMMRLEKKDENFFKHYRTLSKNKPLFEKKVKEMLGQEAQVFYAGNEIKIRFRTQEHFATALESFRKEAPEEPKED